MVLQFFMLVERGNRPISHPELDTVGEPYTDSSAPSALRFVFCVEVGVVRAAPAPHQLPHKKQSEPA